MQMRLIGAFKIRYLIIAALVLSEFSVIPAASAATSGSGICQQTYSISAGSESVVVTSAGNYCYVAFKNLGSAGATSSSYSWTKPNGITSLDVLVIGGGGGGGARHGGGGGAGSFVQTSSYPVASAQTSINVVVGSGGAGAAGAAIGYLGSKGNDSSIKIGANGLTALGGGAGVNGSTADVNGGSGGGAGALQTAGNAATSTQKTLDGASTISGIEFGNGGASGVGDPNSGTSSSYDFWAAGGGGGAGAAGKRPTVNGSEYFSSYFADGNGSGTRGGDGGIGKVSSIISDAVATALGIGQVSGGSAYFAAGGGGGMGADGVAGGLGGTGGGGNGTKAIASGGVAALVSSGSGGGGSGFDDISPVAGDVQNPPGGAGGSGIVVIRYIPPSPAVTSSATISGTTMFNQVLTSTTGVWNNTPSTYAYQWLRAATSGGSYSSISGANSSTYTLAGADVGQFIKVAVTASNVGGPTTDTSTATAVITAVTSSTSVSLAVGNLFFRTAKLITATPTVAGKLTFRANNVIIPGCKNLSASANVAKSCSYRPNTRGYVRISVALVPTDAGFASNTTTTTSYFVYQRSGAR
jgi:hypothetical protein